MAETFSKEGALKAWNEHAGKVDQFDVRVVEGVDGKKQTQLIDKDTGSLCVAVDGDGNDVWKTLTEQAGVWKIDNGVNPKSAVEDTNEVFKTSKNALATPTQPEALEGEKPVVEVDNRTDADKEAQDSPAENVSKARAKAE